LNRTLALSVCVAFIALAASPFVFALPQIDKEWKERYIETVPPPPFKGDAAMQKCNVCHEGMNKKDKNEHGKAVGKHLTKKGVTDLKGMDAALKKYIQDALEKAEEEKNSKDKKFGDIMKKDGKLPGAK
jgi:hypothetical protein